MGIFVLISIYYGIICRQNYNNKIKNNVMKKISWTNNVVQGLSLSPICREGQMLACLLASLSVTNQILLVLCDPNRFC